MHRSNSIDEADLLSPWKAIGVLVCDDIIGNDVNKHYVLSHQFATTNDHNALPPPVAFFYNSTRHVRCPIHCRHLDDCTNLLRWQSPTAFPYHAFYPLYIECSNHPKKAMRDDTQSFPGVRISKRRHLQAAPTSQPTTKSPTNLPTTTKSPTNLPTTTKSPTTKSPTNLPTTTKSPTKNPTTKSPTSPPTTKSPTSPPTTTKSPTNPPTTKKPTTQPTKKPTTQPTKKPTTQPTKKPTTQPTKKPTTQPTKRPTKRPSASPTRHPTHPPTGHPTFVPTGVPTVTPTNNPTSSPVISPTNAPTNSPTKAPTSAGLQNFANTKKYIFIYTYTVTFLKN
ncbi:hypothetical protein RFI_06537 [Reticulomyxa filosa]|uniref:Peritrophic matrix protein 1-C n=1 Tax=Reticulomyxa filosa TaxID=46433 RepID=X6NXG8_RETFI|nr:hypothetical protein RFI_06537 [Reticulomyxa filosa]|eukprot:ETO30578.1 hypothetical protein RFI_06537 [Reticulomyxa filosa]